MAWWDKDGKSRMAARTAPDGYTGLSLWDLSGVERIGIATTMSGNALTQYMDPSGAARIQIGTTAQGTVELPESPAAPVPDPVVLPQTPPAQAISAFPPPRDRPRD